MSIPLWVPLVVAGIGLLGTIVGTTTGVIITQRPRTVGRRRERAREREVWEREDVLRNFEARRDAYVSFYEALRKMAWTAYDHGMGLSEAPVEEDEVHHLLDVADRQAGKHADADAPAVWISQGSAPGATEMADEVIKRLRLADFLHGQDIGGQPGDGLGQGRELGLVGRH